MFFLGGANKKDSVCGDDTSMQVFVAPTCFYLGGFLDESVTGREGLVMGVRFASAKSQLLGVER